MPNLNISDPLILVSLAFGLAALSLLIVRLIPERSANTAHPPSRNADQVFVFRGNHLEGPNPERADLPPPLNEAESDWARFRRWTEFRFGALPEDADAVDHMLDLPSVLPDMAQLICTRHGEALHVTLHDPMSSDAADRHTGLYREMLLRDRDVMLDTIPMPIWHLDAQARTLWQNGSASALSWDEIAPRLPQSGAWPAPGQSTTVRYRAKTGADRGSARQYDLHINVTGQGAILCAEDVTRQVQAEKMQRDFVQTLSKTFADLSTGLVIFDKAKSLALFNPALIDLTGLQPAFLTARPDLFAFFDALRAKAVMPEPRDYASWRSQIRAIVDSAEGGYYRDVWNLPGDHIYRVTGRPHPDGAIAFLFENISEEVSATRRDRKEIELRQTVLDSMADGIAVFARDGQLILCNTVFRAGFGTISGADMTQITLQRAIAALGGKPGDTKPRSGQPCHDESGADDLRQRLRIITIGGGRCMLLVRRETLGVQTDTLGVPAE